MKENKNWKKQIALFLISQNLSMFGSSVVGFSIVWYITVTTESGFWITLSTLATLIPQVLVSLWAGVFADRYNKKTIIMLADGFTALATLLAFVAFVFGYQMSAAGRYPLCSDAACLIGVDELSGKSGCCDC